MDREATTDRLYDWFSSLVGLDRIPIARLMDLTAATVMGRHPGLQWTVESSDAGGVDLHPQPAVRPVGVNR